MTTAGTPHDDARMLRLCADALRAARTLLALSTGLSIVAAVGVALAGIIAGASLHGGWG